MAKNAFKAVKPRFIRVILLENGNFVTPSKIEIQDYVENDKVY